MIRLFFTLILGLLTGFQLTAQNVSDSVVLGNAYTNDVFFDFSKAEKHTASRTEWDIAFSTNVMSISVLANDAAGIEVYAYGKASATDAWLNVDTTGMNRKLLYNSDTSWEYGAFVRNTVAGDQFDYGWGRYNINNHKITGDSIFILKLQDESWLQFMIQEKDAPLNKWVFKYAQLDGSDERQITLQANDYADLHFIGFSFASGAFLAHEPAKNDWDIQFTKYTAPVFMGPQAVPYPVTGVLTAPGVQMISTRQSGMDQDTFEDYNEAGFASNRAGIGYNWKETEGMPPVYVMVDTVMYFVKDADGSVSKIFFTGFESGLSGEGKIWFDYKVLSDASSVSEGATIDLLEVYPNPAKEQANIVLNATQGGVYNIEVRNLSGKLLISEQIMLEKDRLLSHRVNMQYLPPAVYLLQIISEDGHKISRKIVHQ